MFERILKLGSTGSDVKALQIILNKDGHGLIDDGIFGTGTKKAVIAFQKKHKLLADGLVGPATQNALKTLLHRKYSITWYKKYIQVFRFLKSDVEELELVNSITPFETVPRMMNRLERKPTLLFNGGLFDTKTGTSLSRFKDDGKLIAGGYYSKYGLYIGKNGSIKFGIDDASSDEFLGFSPSIIVNKEILIDRTNLSPSFVDSRHPRTAFAESETEYFIIMVHGRRSWLSHIGMTIKELATFCLVELKAINAGNFDGGGSCMIVDELGNILNTHLEVRGVDNCVGVRLRK